MRKSKQLASSNQPALQWSHRNPGAMTASRKGKKPDVAEILAKHKAPMRADSIPPPIDGLYPPDTTVVAMDPGAGSHEQEDAAQREMILLERQKLEEVMQRRLKALADEEAARTANKARQDQQRAKRTQEGYGECRNMPVKRRVRSRKVAAIVAVPASPPCPVVPITRQKTPYRHMSPYNRLRRAS